MATGGVNNRSNGNTYVQHNSDIDLKEKKYDLASLFKAGTVFSDDLKEIFAKVDENHNNILDADEIEKLGLKSDKQYSLKSIMKMLGIKKSDGETVQKLRTALESGNLSETTRETKDGYKITTRMVDGEKTIEIRYKDDKLRKQETVRKDGTKETFFYTINEKGQSVKHQTVENPDGSVERIFYDENDNPEQKQVEKTENGVKTTNVFSLKNGGDGQKTLSIVENSNENTIETTHFNENDDITQITKDEMSSSNKLQKRTTTAFGEKNTTSETVTEYNNGTPVKGTTTVKVGDNVVREGDTTYNAQGKKATETVKYFKGGLIQPNFGSDTKSQTSVTTYSEDGYTQEITTENKHGVKIVSTAQYDKAGKEISKTVIETRGSNEKIESHYENGLIQSETITSNERTEEKNFTYDGDRLVGERVEVTIRDPESGDIVDHEVSEIKYEHQDGSVLGTINSKEEVNGKIITQDFQRRDGYEIPGRKTTVVEE